MPHVELLVGPPNVLNIKYIWAHLVHPIVFPWLLQPSMSIFVVIRDGNQWNCSITN